MFDRAGKPIGAVGRMGDGPGEFQTPYGVLFDTAGGLVAADHQGRLTRFSRDLQLDTVARVNGTTKGMLALPGNRLLVHMF